MQANNRGWARIAVIQAAPHFKPSTHTKKRILLRHSSVTSRWSVEKLRSVQSPGTPYFFIKRSGNIVQLVSLNDTATCDLFTLDSDTVDVLIEGSAHDPWSSAVFNAVALVIGYIAQECRIDLHEKTLLYAPDLPHASRLDPDFLEMITLLPPKQNLCRLGTWIRDRGFWALWGDSYPLTSDNQRHPIPRLWLQNAARLGRATTVLSCPVEHSTLEIQFFEGGFIWGLPGRAYRVVWTPRLERLDYS